MLSFINRPNAIADIRGGKATPELVGKVKFYQKHGLVLLIINVFNLPENNETGFFALHIHEGNDCSGEGFSNTGSHYNPDKSPHPNHAGDLPPLLSCDGEAYMAVCTDRFAVNDVIGRTLVIHGSPDDFKSQPSGNAGEKIACGVICKA